MGIEDRKGHARLTPVDAAGVPCGDSIFLSEAVDIARVGEDNFSVSLPMGATISERYLVELWVPQERRDVTAPQSYTYIRDTNYPLLRGKWDEDHWETIVALKNSHGRQILWPDAEELRTHVGQWVAVVDGKVMWSRDTVKELIHHLCGVDVEVDSIFRVPESWEHDER